MRDFHSLLLAGLPGAPEILGDHEFMMLWACAFEDFLTRDCEPDGRNIVDGYLKRRGWKEPIANRK